MIEYAIANYLATDTAVNDLLSGNNQGTSPLGDTLPQQTWLTAGSAEEKRLASITAQRAPESQAKPFVVVTGPDLYDHGNTSDAVCSTKQEDCTIVIATDGPSSDLVPLLKRILLILDVLRSETVSGYHIQACMIGNVSLTDLAASDNDQQPLSAYQIEIKVPYSE